MCRPALHVAAALLVALAGVAPVVALATAAGPPTETPTAQRAVGATTAPTLSTWIAPANATLTTADELAAAKAATNGTDQLTRAERVALNDTLVVTVAAAGLDDRVANATGPNLTAKFRSVVRTDDAVSLRVNQTDDTVTPMEEPKALLALDPGALTVVRMDDRDSYALVYDTAALTARPRDGGDRRFEVDQGERYWFEVAVDDRRERIVVEFLDRTAGFATAEQVLLPDEVPTPEAVTTVAPGTAVQIRVRDGNDTVVERRTVRVTNDAVASDDPARPDGYRVPVPLSFDDLAVGETRSLALPAFERYDGDLARTVLRVRAERGTIDRIDAGIYEETTRVVADVRLSHGGFVVLRDDEGRVLDTFGPFPPAENEVRSPRLVPSAPLSAGQTVAIELYRDSDDDGRFEPEADEQYRRNGTPVRATATVYDGRDEVTPADPPPTTRPTTEQYTPGRRVPGFGTVATLVALFLGTGLLARRREGA